MEGIAIQNGPFEYMHISCLQTHYKVIIDERARAAQSMCKLCEKLNEENIETKSYETLGNWWWGGGKCKNKVCIMHIVKRFEWVTVFYRAMYLGIDLSQSGATRFSSSFLEDEEYVTDKTDFQQNQISLFNGE